MDYQLNKKLKSLQRNWVTPYEVKPHWPFGYIIVFEESTNLGWYLNKSDAKTICGQLNGAYNLGRSSVVSELYD